MLSGQIVRKLNWEDVEVAAYIVKCVKNVWNIKYFNIRYLASLLAGLVQGRSKICDPLSDQTHPFR